MTPRSFTAGQRRGQAPHLVCDAFCKTHGCLVHECAKCVSISARLGGAENADLGRQAEPAK